MVIFYVGSIAGYGPVTQTMKSWDYFGSVYGLWTILWACAIAVPLNIFLWPTTSTSSIRGSLQGALKRLAADLPILAKAGPVATDSTSYIASEALEISFRPAYAAFRALAPLRKALALDITFGRDHPGAMRLLSSEAEKLGTALAAALGSAEHWERWTQSKSSGGIAGFVPVASSALTEKTPILLDRMAESLLRSAALILGRPSESVDLAGSGELSAAVADYKATIAEAHFAAVPVAPGTLNPDGYVALAAHGARSLFFEGVLELSCAAESLEKAAGHVDAARGSRRLWFGWTSWNSGKQDVEKGAQSDEEIRTKEVNAEDAKETVDSMYASPAQLPPPTLTVGTDSGSATPGRNAIAPYKEPKGCFGVLGNLWHAVFTFFGSLESQEGVRYMSAAFIVGLWGVLPFSTAFYATWRLDWIMFSAIIVLAIPSVGATLWKAVARVLAAILPSLLAILALLPDDGQNPYSIVCIGAVLSIFTGYCQLFISPLADFGTVGISTYIIITSSYYRAARPPGFTVVEISMIRCAMMITGCLLGITISWAINPRLSRARVREYTAKSCAEVASLVDGLARGAPKGLESVLRSAEASLDIARGQMNWAAGEPDLDRPFYAQAFAEMGRVIAGMLANCSSALEVMRAAQAQGLGTQLVDENRAQQVSDARADFYKLATDLAVTLQICASCLNAKRPLPALLPDLDRSRKSFVLSYHVARDPTQRGADKYAIDLVSVALGVLVSGDVEDLVSLVSSVVGREAGI